MAHYSPSIFTIYLLYIQPLNIVITIILSLLGYYLYQYKLNDPTNDWIEYLLYLLLIMICVILCKVFKQI